jgi:hypothetical protein
LLSAICDDVDLGLEVVGFIEVLAAVQQACRSGSGKSRRVVDGEVERRRRVCDCSDRLGLANALATERSPQPRPAHERSPSNGITPRIAVALLRLGDTSSECNLEERLLHV